MSYDWSVVTRKTRENEEVEKSHLFSGGKSHSLSAIAQKNWAAKFSSKGRVLCYNDSTGK